MIIPVKRRIPMTWLIFKSSKRLEFPVLGNDFYRLDGAIFTIFTLRNSIEQILLIVIDG